MLLHLVLSRPLHARIIVHPEDTDALVLAVARLKIYICLCMRVSSSALPLAPGQICATLQLTRICVCFLTRQQSLFPKADVDRLYLARAESGRGLIGVEDCIALRAW